MRMSACSSSPPSTPSEWASRLSRLMKLSASSHTSSRDSWSSVLKASSCWGGSQYRCAVTAFVRYLCKLTSTAQGYDISFLITNTHSETMLKHKIVDFIIQCATWSRSFPHQPLISWLLQVHGGSGQGNQWNEAQPKRASAYRRRVLPHCCAPKLIVVNDMHWPFTSSMRRDTLRYPRSLYYHTISKSLTQILQISQLSHHYSSLLLWILASSLHLTPPLLLQYGMATYVYSPSSLARSRHFLDPFQPHPGDLF